MNILLLFIFIALSNAADGLKIYVFDVGQADSQLIVFPSGYSILIDTGEPSGGKGIAGENSVYIGKRIEEILGKKKVDVFVLTHYHVDHAGEVNYGGIWYLMEKLGFTVGKFLRREPATYKGSSLDNCKKTTLEWRYAGEMYDYTAKFICYSVSSVAKTKLSTVAELAHRCNSQQIVPPDSGAEVRVLIRDALGIKDQNGKLIPGNYVDKEGRPGENDYSICMRIKWKDFVYATCGDLSGHTYQTGSGFWYHDIESRVAPMMGEVDLYHVNHHGCKSSTNTLWTNTLKPTVSVISCGDGSTLPEKQPLDNLKNVNSKVYMTNNCNPDLVAKYNNVVNFNGDIVIVVSNDGDIFRVEKKDGSNSKDFATKLNKPTPSKCVLLEQE